jgi:hypothetical protein
MIFGATGGTGAFGALQGLGWAVGNSTTLFQDAFDGFEQTPEELLPKATSPKGVI